MNIIITGAAGFIPSCLAHHLAKSDANLILVDNFNKENKLINLVGLEGHLKIDRNNLFNWLDKENPDVDYVFHLGARTDTTEFNKEIFDQLNVQYSKDIWMYCAMEEIPLIYASSAATYGLGEHGFIDDHKIVNELKPLNPYGDSKNDFDKWALDQFMEPPFWAGFKFFNVFGPNEYHKGRMASVVFHFYHQIKNKGEVNLFKSHKEDYKHGEQTRDFIYINDLIKTIIYFYNNHKEIENGLYNLGTGLSRTYNDLAKAIYKAINKDVIINYIDTPEDIRDTYQYYTEADMSKVKAAGYKEEFMKLEDSVSHYVKTYLENNNKPYNPE